MIGGNTKLSSLSQKRGTLNLGIDTKLKNPFNFVNFKDDAQIDVDILNKKFEDLIELCKKLDVSVLSFDFDNTMTQIHTAKSIFEGGLELSCHSVEKNYGNNDGQRVAFSKNAEIFWQILVDKLQKNNLKTIILSKQDTPTIEFILKFHNIPIDDVFGVDKLRKQSVEISDTDLRKYKTLDKILKNVKENNNKIIHFDDDAQEVDAINEQKNPKILALKIEPAKFIDEFLSFNFFQDIEEKILKHEMLEVKLNLNSKLSFEEQKLNS